ncbi:MAG: ArsC/Spx/MgsR family protein [Bacteroidota bacterium]
MKKIFHLSTCNTCQRIIGELNTADEFELQDVKTTAITAEELDAMYAQTGSYESLFNRRARKYRAEGLHEQTLEEQDYRRLILGEYTFLKRPAVWIGDQLFVGNSKKVVAAAKTALQADRETLD